MSRRVDWFERLTGFAESEHAVREQLQVEGEFLHSRANGATYRIGRLETPSLFELRERVRHMSISNGPLQVKTVKGDARALHRDLAYQGALFQVASQFNLLEMTGPSVCPEDGITRYAFDATQGPACAIAAGAATIYRNYFVPLEDQVGQSARSQVDTLADLGSALSQVLEVPVSALWTMRNGYALCTADGLRRIGAHLASLDASGRDALRARLRIGLHWNVEVTDETRPPRPVVSQAFCSALPVAYSSVPPKLWEPFARLVLEAAYEATLLAAALHPSLGGRPIVALTRLGGGAFGNDSRWIDDAIDHAFNSVGDLAIEAHLVTLR
ncbi:MAG: hypothetical protein ACP5GF_12550 [Thiomonas sp.]